MRLTHARAVHKAEAANPELEQRLTTFQERERKGSDPFLELLAADTLALTEHAAPASLVGRKRLFVSSGAGAACLAVLVWLIAAGPGYLGYGSSLLWTGPPKNRSRYYSISVTPGNITVRRNSDQLITRAITGMQPGERATFAHYQSAPLGTGAMQAQPNAGGAATYQFVLAGLPENVEYYVAAGPLVSPHYTVRVVDLPPVKEIRVTYHYPKWTGLKPVTEEHSGDLRAIEGTDADIEIQMDRPLKNGQLALDDGQIDSPCRRARETGIAAVSTWRRMAPTTWPRLMKASRCGSRRTTSSQPTRRSRRRSPSIGRGAIIAPARLKKSRWA